MPTQTLRHFHVSLLIHLTLPPTMPPTFINKFFVHKKHVFLLESPKIFILGPHGSPDLLFATPSVPPPSNSENNQYDFAGHLMLQFFYQCWLPVGNSFSVIYSRLYRFTGKQGIGAGSKESRFLLICSLNRLYMGHNSLHGWPRPTPRPSESTLRTARITITFL